MKTWNTKDADERVGGRGINVPVERHQH